MNVFTHLLFFCSIINLVVGIGMFRFDRKAVLNRIFFALILSVFIWSFSSAFSVIAPDRAGSIFWHKIASIGYCTFASISLHFFLIYAKKDNLLSKWWTYIVLYLPAAVFLFQSIKQDLYFRDVTYSQYGWRTIANSESAWYWTFILLTGLSGIINMYLCYSTLKSCTSIRERKQSKIIVFSTMLSFLVTMGYHLLVVVVIKANIPDITVVGLMIWLLGIVYSIVRYRLMLLSPSFAADSILKTIIDSVILVNPKGLITYINSETLSLLGYERAELIEKPFEMLFPKEIKLEMEDIVKTLERGCIRNKDTFFLSKNNKIIPILFSASVCNNADGDYIGFVAISRDITEYRQREEKIKFLSYHDQLTGLYNRRYYEEELKRLDTKRNLPISIVMGDVNGLKMINDSFGHEKGDELLKKAAQAIQNGCRSDDITARLGGDEFVVLLPKTDIVQAKEIVKRINELVIKEKVEGIDISVSFGYAVKMNENEKIQEIFKAAEDQMYEYKLLNSKNTRRNTIDLIMNTLFEKNHREMLHSKRVSELCEAIALKMDFDLENVYKIKIAGLMHDIGKIGIDDKTLNKPDKLDAAEWIEMKKHPEIGQRILSAASEFSDIGNYIYEHQEKWDGTGYPRGLKGEDILLQARIIAVADSYDAMTSHRNYGKELSQEEAIKEIKRCSGTQFDPTIARLFVENVLGKEWPL